MKSFKNIKFLGTFRNYQQRVLDSSNKYLKNNKIHIVAAPGSGKTILGLEIIRRLNSPCIVLSPTNTIRYQWGDRFKSMFLSQDADVDNYVSYDLNSVKLITSITYQAMHSAINKVACVDEDNNQVDYSQIDLFKLINEYGIKTICVDEAHHLQNEWQKALEVFIGGLNKDIKIIALTATPPYDATPVEWNRYIKICGEIDEEIFVTELVRAKNLCPHQDYIYLNYPTKEESLILNDFKQKVQLALAEIKLKPFIQKIEDNIFKTLKENELFAIDNNKSLIDVFGLLSYFEIDCNYNKAKRLLNTNSFPFGFENMENALNFFINNEFLLNKDEKEDLINTLKKYGLIERGKTRIYTNDKIDKTLLQSMGKMESIVKIVDCEYSNLQKNLKMLVLTDFIRAKDLNKIGTNDLFKDISIVSIFETIRRCKPDIVISALSSSLVILPTILEKDVKNILGKRQNKFSITPIKETGYSEFKFSLNNKEIVSIVNKLFEDGKINIIVGTKSLLGEGWDSPCINSLIMASFVGSFMLSNQMRGRAIRVYKNDPSKTANIWHLVTLEPEMENVNLKVECNEESSSDYKTLKRRFNCFVGPHYTKSSVESGIERIAILKNAYTKESVNEVNTQMEKFAKDRTALHNKWMTGNDLMHMQCEIPNDRIPKKFGVLNLIFSTIPLALLIFITAYILPMSIKNSFVDGIYHFVSVILFCYFIKSLIKTLCLCFKKLFILNVAKGIKKSLEKLNVIETNAKINVESNKENVTLSIMLDSIKEQKIFLNCVQEFLSPLNNPRYILAATFGPFILYKYSFQLPDLLCSNKQIANMAQDNLKILNPSLLIYANSTKSKAMVLKCVKKNYIKATSEINQKQKS